MLGVTDLALRLTRTPPLAALPLSASSADNDFATLLRRRSGHDPVQMCWQEELWWAALPCVERQRPGRHPVQRLQRQTKVAVGISSSRGVREPTRAPALPTTRERRKRRVEGPRGSGR